MIIIPESREDMWKLANWYSQGRITADTYFEAVDRWAKVQVEAEIQAERFKQKSVKKNKTFQFRKKFK